MALKILKCDNQASAVQAAADTLSDFLEDQGPMLLLCSGGSALTLLDSVRLPPSTQHMTISVLDERFDPPEASNYRALTKSVLFKGALAGGAACIDPRPTAGEVMGACAARFEQALRKWCHDNPQGTIIATMGIGTDGHTAGILPFGDEFHRVALFDKGAGWVIGYDCGTYHQYPKRISVRHTFLRTIDHALVYVVGAEKKEALRAALAKEGSLVSTPARIIHEMKDVIVVTDVTNR